MATAPLDPEAILEVIASWPVDKQITLARTIMQRAEGRSGAAALPSEAQTPEHSTWEELYGIASNGQAPPSDEQVAKWLDEHRTEKYGG